MSWAERMADETAHHFSELRQRRVPLMLAAWMTLRFHDHLCRTVLLDDQFDQEVQKILAPVAEAS